MQPIQLSKAYSERGASMGRTDTIPDKLQSPVTLGIEPLPWHDGDYDAGGAYWGDSRDGSRIYCAHGHDAAGERVEYFCRAKSEADAKSEIERILTGARPFHEIEWQAVDNGWDDFSTGYAHAALWSSLDENGAPLDEAYGLGDIDEKTAVQMRADCAAFREANAAQLEASGLSNERAGFLFWLNRNGHGSGFWDEISDCETLGLMKTAEGLAALERAKAGLPCQCRYHACQRLSDACEPYGEVNLFVGEDGKVCGE